jgi:hypothetical protein
MLGMIARSLTDPSPVIDFLKNAKVYGHKIDRVIVAVSGVVCQETVRAIEVMAPLELIRVNAREGLVRELLSAGLPEQSLDALLTSEIYEHCGQMPYGQNRNQILLTAMLRGAETLFFIDSDVYPICLTGTPENQVFEDLDFFGRHLEALKDPHVGITTSDYSGYYILPPMNFPDLNLFLEGLQKESALEFVRNSEVHHGLVFDAGAIRKSFKTDKILGGNMAIRLEIFREDLPFFSSAYTFEGDCWLTRGEDTLLGRGLSTSDTWSVIDIDTRIFHNTFGSYPEIPDPRIHPYVRDRLYGTCMGWIGRNPVINALAGEAAFDISQRQIECLTASVAEAADYFNDRRFLKLPDAARAAYRQLPDMLAQHEILKQNWPRAFEIIMSRRR